MENLTGKQLGPYRIIDKLGIGGMATVFKAYQPNMDRLVAVKVLPRRLSTHSQFLLRFRQEAKVIARLEHPHILPVHDFGESEGYAYLVMRLVEGGSLADLLRRKSRLDIATACRMIRQVGEALDCAHEQGIVHRDIKPGNILLDRFGNCLLTDFGIAKLVETTEGLTSTGGILGTPSYLSPEQGMGERVDYRSDIYSLGVLLYQMVTGDVPFKADTPMGVIFKHVHEPPVLPLDAEPRLPESLERTILRALAKKPEDRFGSSSDMVSSLGAIAAQPIPSSPMPDAPHADSADASTTEVIPETEPPPRQYVRFALWVILGATILSGVGWLLQQKFAVSKATLAIRTRPELAAVYIDGSHAGLSPLEIEDFTPGVHQIQVQKERYQDYREDVSLKAGEQRNMEIALIPLPYGDLEVVSDPEGAAVFIEDEEKGTTPISIKDHPAGKYRVVLKKKGFDPWERTVEIVPFKSATLSAELVTVYGELLVNSIPKGAKLWIDGQFYGKTPRRIKQVWKGSHTIELQTPGFPSWKDTVVIDIDEPTRVDVDFFILYQSGK